MAKSLETIKLSLAVLRKVEKLSQLFNDQIIRKVTKRIQHSNPVSFPYVKS